MAVTIKSPREIELMRKAGEILAQVHEELHAAVHPGMSTLDIDKLGERLIRSHGCIPSFKNYNGYPASICVSVTASVHHITVCYSIARITLPASLVAESWMIL